MVFVCYILCMLLQFSFLFYLNWDVLFYIRDKCLHKAPITILTQHKVLHFKRQKRKKNLFTTMFVMCDFICAIKNVFVFNLCFIGCTIEIIIFWFIHNNINKIKRFHHLKVSCGLFIDFFFFVFNSFILLINSLSSSV